jgi:hypothetical protein
MRLFLTALLIFSICSTKAQQNTIDWDGAYEIQLSDFQSPSTEIGNESIISLNTDSHVDFSFYMSNAEFMFTKNFNPKVGCTFKRDASALVAPDSVYATKLVNFARYGFDLAELYARKFRQQLYLNKGVFSNVSFFQPLFDKMQKDHQLRYTQASKETQLGADVEKVDELRKQVKIEIAALADFCKTCKPPKRQKE